MARLVQLGIQQARHFGRARTKFQLYLAATVANLALLPDKINLIGDPDPWLPAFPNVAYDGVESSANLRIDLLSILACISAAWLTKATPSKWAFPLNFQRRKFQ